MVNLNGMLVKEPPPGLALAQRGLYYADALSETIRVFDSRCPLLEGHWARLSRGLDLMRYQIPAHWSADFFHREIRRTAPANARVRLTVWRSPGGLYAPEHDTPQFLIAAVALDTGIYEWLSGGIGIGRCNSVRLPVDAYSGLKTLNAARYVAAAIEARERNWDDAILLNAYGQVCETTNSNIFWLENGVWCTPPLTDGCVTGVMRDLLLTLTLEAGYAVQEKSATFARLLAAEEVFLSNAIRGIRWVRDLEGKAFKNEKTRTLYQLMADHIVSKIAG